MSGGYEPTADPRWSNPDFLEQGIANALAAGDVEAVPVFLSAIAAVDLDRAGKVMETLKAGLLVASVLSGEANR